VKFFSFHSEKLAGKLDPDGFDSPALPTPESVKERFREVIEEIMRMIERFSGFEPENRIHYLDESPVPSHFP
jgi:hypothetical protein